MKIDKEMLKYALVGLQSKKAVLNQKIYELEASLAGHILPTSQQTPKKTAKQRRKSHTMSAAGRKAVSDAQKARWRKIRREKKLQGLKKSGK